MAASAVTVKPAMGVGLKPSGQPLAGAMFTVGIKRLTGLGSVGVDPMPSVGNKVAVSPQALRLTATSKASRGRMAVFAPALRHVIDVMGRVLACMRNP